METTNQKRKSEFWKHGPHDDDGVGSERVGELREVVGRKLDDDAAEDLPEMRPRIEDVLVVEQREDAGVAEDERPVGGRERTEERLGGRVGEERGDLQDDVLRDVAAECEARQRGEVRGRRGDSLQRVDDVGRKPKPSIASHCARQMRRQSVDAGFWRSEA